MVVWNCLEERLFTIAIGFAHLSFDAIAVDGMFEVLLGYANQDLYRDINLFARYFLVHNSQRVGDH